MNLRSLSPIAIKTVNRNQLQSLLKSKPTPASCDSDKPTQGIFSITERLHYGAWRGDIKSSGSLMYQNYCNHKLKIPIPDFKQLNGNLHYLRRKYLFDLTPDYSHQLRNK